MTAPGSALVRFYLASVDAGPATYYHWLDPDNPETAGAERVESDDVIAALERIEDALPHPGGAASPEGDPTTPGSASRPREVTAEDVRRSLHDALWCDAEESAGILEPLARDYLPIEVKDRLQSLPTSAPGQSGSARLIVAPGPRWATLPWELLPLGDGRRLADVADVQLAVALPLLYDRSRQPDPPSEQDRPLYVIDPSNKGHGQILSRRHDAKEVRIWDHKMKDQEVKKPTRTVNRRRLSAWLQQGRADDGESAPYGRLLFLGHCVGPVEDAPTTAGMVLSELEPLTAQDLLFGENDTPGAQLWPMPPRVALIACASGTEQTHFEPLGLVSALVNNGAEYVTATRWMLPADGLCDGATTALALAVDRAHQEPDPVASLGAWQRTKLTEWLADPGSPAHSPLLWASVSTYRARRIDNPASTAT